MDLSDDMSLPKLENCSVSVIGLGYVGLPLAVELALTKNSYLDDIILDRRVIGFDINNERIDQLNSGIDHTGEVLEATLSLDNLIFTSRQDLLMDSDVYIITVPTPIDSSNNPDLTPLEMATSTVGEVLALRLKENENFKSNPIIIYESTVYPGVTEEICVPILEEKSGLKFNNKNNKNTFFCGYSPERINPGDKKNKITNVVKVTSGSNVYVADWIDKFYGSFIKAGTFSAASIKVAEAAKVIENIQRDINIALINEFAVIFKLLSIDTLDVLAAANTKWNFMSFKPGLVGGHCIGVDPYYLTYKAQQLGYHPEIVLAGRRINEQMSKWSVDQLIQRMASKGLVIGGSNSLILGLTFKENCPDIRNTKVIDLYNHLIDFSILVDVVDPYVDINNAYSMYSIKALRSIPKNKKYESVILAVAHDKFNDYMLDEWKSLLTKNGTFLDLKGIIPRELNPIRV